MLRTLPQTRSDVLTHRLIGIVLFTVLTAIAAKIRVGWFPVPFTMQTAVVLLAGLVLGARDGFLSQLAYLGLIAINLPVDTNSAGIAAFAGPTVGFLIAFPISAFVAGYLAERGADNLWIRWGAGLVASAILIAIGVIGFSAIYGGGNLIRSWQLVGQPFVLIEIAKALLAAALAESGRTALTRVQSPDNQE